jgi:polar amino acid transport system substrate-binding protein
MPWGCRIPANRGIAAILADGSYDEVTARYFATPIHGN